MEKQHAAHAGEQTDWRRGRIDPARLGPPGRREGLADERAEADNALVIWAEAVLGRRDADGEATRGLPQDLLPRQRSDS
jgi:hypothetical protein